MPLGNVPSASGGDGIPRLCMLQMSHGTAHCLKPSRYLPGTNQLWMRSARYAPAMFPPRIARLSAASAATSSPARWSRAFGWRGRVLSLAARCTDWSEVMLDHALILLSMIVRPCYSVCPVRPLGCAFPRWEGARFACGAHRMVYAAHSMGLSCRAEVGRMSRLRRGCPDLDSLMAWMAISPTLGPINF